jgi:hypothetical protein
MTLLEKKLEIIKLLKPADVLLSFNRDNKLSATIARITDSSWSHVMMYIGNGNIVESSVGGVHITSIKHYLDDKYDLCLLRANLFSQQDKKIVKYSLSLVGKKYGYLQMLWYAFIRLIGKSESPKWQLDIQPNAMVCSEAIAESYRKNGLTIKTSIKDTGAEPADFWESNIFRKIKLAR